LNVIACNELSCLYTELVEKDVLTDTVPVSYVIGINNVAGYTYFSNYYDTVGNACLSNP
jgi:hypothetical protein